MTKVCRIFSFMENGGLRASPVVSLLAALRVKAVNCHYKHKVNILLNLCL
jgi:hypothetical protein